MNSLFADFLPVTALNCDAKKKELISALKNGDITPIEGVDIVREVIADPDSDDKLFLKDESVVLALKRTRVPREVQYDTRKEIYDLLILLYKKPRGYVVE